jgi:prophage antirepressor-like protein
MHILQPTLFTRHHRALRAVVHNRQIWFCAQDLGRLMGVHLSPRILEKLDDDQRVDACLEHAGRREEKALISESGAYTMLVHHNIPENRALRYWLTHEVVAAMWGRAGAMLA